MAAPVGYVCWFPAPEVIDSGWQKYTPEASIVGFMLSTWLEVSEDVVLHGENDGTYRKFQVFHSILTICLTDPLHTTVRISATDPMAKLMSVTGADMPKMW